jgi:hypothetical protein
MLIKYLIYPAIGVARMGPADEFYYHPEQTVLAQVAGAEWQPSREAYPPSTAAPTDLGKFRNAAGEILRQAARFRIYKVWFKERWHDGTEVSLPEKAELVDLKAAGVTCEWTVKVANKKSFRTTPRPAFNRTSPAGRVWNEAQGTVSSSGGFAAGTKKLEGGETIAGGKYLLAEIFTDDVGRLVVLAGKGRMDGPEPVLTGSGGELFLKDWFDDACDGSVECKLTIGGEQKKVERAWIVTGSPRFAPAIPPVVSVYDNAQSLANHRGQLRFPSKVSFERDLYQIFETVVRQRPVSKDAVEQHSTLEARSDILSLANNAASARADRDVVASVLQKPANRFRKRAHPYNDGASEEAFGGTNSYERYKHRRLSDGTHLHKMPLQIGLAYSAYQLRVLCHWVLGDFSGYTGTLPPPHWKRPAFDSLPAIEQIDALNYAYMGNMLGASTIPGIEVCYRAQMWSTWHKKLGFRVAPELNPGELTEGLSVPWAADYLSCRAQAPTGPGARDIEWWPAHRPVTVLPAAGSDPGSDSVEWDRGDWDRASTARLLNWKKLGFVNLETDVAGVKWRRESERTL